MRRVLWLLVVIGACVFAPTMAAAQQAQANIAGVVKDASGGVLTTTHVYQKRCRYS